MAKNIDYYRKISGSYGTASKQEYQRDALANDLYNKFDGSIALETVLVNGVSKTVIIQKAGIQNNIRDIHKITMKPPDTISVGDVITWNSVKWLCVQADDVHGIYEYGNIQECKNELKYYDDNYVLYTKPCVVYSGSSSEDEGKYITLASDEHILYCRNETDTGHINLNTRFILSGDAYKVVGIDRLSKVGLLEIKVKADGIVESDDRVDLGIANWGSNQYTYEIAILNGNYVELFFGNTTLQLNVQVQRNGEIISSPMITYASSNNSIAIVSSTGLITAKGTGDVIITATAYGVSDTITIRGDIDSDSIYAVTITPIDTTVKTGRTMTLEAHAMNNGVEDLLKQFNWTLRNSDGSSSVYATILPTSTNNKNCILTAGLFTNKYIIVRASLTNDPTKYIDKTIKIVNLF